MDKLEQVKQILEEVIPKYFLFQIICYRNKWGWGAFNPLYTEKVMKHLRI